MDINGNNKFESTKIEGVRGDMNIVSVVVFNNSSLSKWLNLYKIASKELEHACTNFLKVA